MLENKKRYCSADEVRHTLSVLMPDITRYWRRPLHAYASVVYDANPFQSDSSERNDAMRRLCRCIERAALKAGYSEDEACSASRQIMDSPVLQSGPHCLLLYEPDAFYTHLFSLLGLKAQGRKWHISYFVSTGSFKESAKKGPGWLTVEGEALNLFGLPRSRMDGASICCRDRPYRFMLTNSSGKSAPNPSAIRLLADLPASEFATGTEAIKAGNLAVWRKKFDTPVMLLQLDDFDVADLVTDHLEDSRSWLSAHFVSDAAAAASLLGAIDELNAGPWRGWIRRTTDLFWHVDANRVVPMQLADNALVSSGHSSLRIEFTPSSLASALRARTILPSMFIAFLVISILPGTRVLGGCRQTIYYPLMRYLWARSVEQSGNQGLLAALRKDYRPGLWGHRTLKPESAYPFGEFENTGGISTLLSKYAQLSLTQASGDLASFTSGLIWSELSSHVIASRIAPQSPEWQWAGFR